MPFRADQRIEFVYLDDVTFAMSVALEKDNSRNQIFNVAGGKTWQMKGNEYVTRLCETLGIDAEVNFPEKYGYFDWYDTVQSQKILGCQKTTLDKFLEKLKNVFEELGETDSL